MAKYIFILCTAGAIACAGYDLVIRHQPLMSWSFDPFTIAGFVLLILAVIAGSKIKPKGS